MKKKLLYPAFAFAAALIFHALYSIREISAVSKRWQQITEATPLALYLERQEYFLGFSYALAAAFTAHAIVRFLQNRRSGIAGVVGGMTLSGVLYFAACFLLGCCGSPMLAVYLSLFGASLLGFTKPFMAILTLTSVVIGYFWMEKRAKAAACCSDGESCQEQSEIKAK